MIASLQGQVILKNETFAIIDVGGIGYKTFAPKETLSALEVENATTLSTHLVVKEDALDLYGFMDAEDRDFFVLLISISGIGPKGALGILDLAPMETLVEAITSGDSGYLTKVSGIGKKTANKLVLELKDKLDARIKESGFKKHASPNHQEESDALDALQSLGYTLKEARDALSTVSKDVKKSDDKIREALKALGK